MVELTMRRLRAGMMLQVSQELRKFSANTQSSVSISVSLQIVVILSRTSPSLASRCSGALGGRPSHYLTGDMLRDSPDCLGPQGQPYPSKYIANMISRQKGRTGRALDLQTIGKNDHRRPVPLTSLPDPLETQKTLLAAHRMSQEGPRVRRDADQEEEKPQCTVGGSPPRLCK